MRNLSILPILSLFFITLGFNSCTKETGIQEADKLSSADCLRLASLTNEKKETLYTVTTYAGENQPDLPFEGDIINGVLCKARFIRPNGIAIDPSGVIYIADQIHNIRKIDKGMVSTFAGSNDGGFFSTGDRDGFGLAARF